MSARRVKRMDSINLINQCVYVTELSLQVIRALLVPSPTSSNPMELPWSAQSYFGIEAGNSSLLGQVGMGALCQGSPNDIQVELD